MSAMAMAATSSSMNRVFGLECNFQCLHKWKLRKLMLIGFCFRIRLRKDSTMVEFISMAAMVMTRASGFFSSSHEFLSVSKRILFGFYVVKSIH